MVEFINKEIKPEVVIWTGDTTPHIEWQNPKKEVKQQHIERVTEFLKANMSYASIYPSLGNHDLSVSNMQNFDEVDPNILFSAE